MKDDKEKARQHERRRAALAHQAYQIRKDKAMIGWAIVIVAVIGMIILAGVQYYYGQ